MGTNYYLRTPNTPADDEGLHLGKSSAGWPFMHRAHPDLGVTTRAEWEAQVRQPDATIVTEYGAPLTVEQMLEIADRRNGLHHRLCDGQYEDGRYRFDPREFC